MIALLSTSITHMPQFLEVSYVSLIQNTQNHKVFDLSVLRIWNILFNGWVSFKKMGGFIYFIIWVHCCCLQTHQKRTSDPITDGCEPPCGCWELNSGPLEEQAASALNHWAISPAPIPIFQAPLFHFRSKMSPKQTLLDFRVGLRWGGSLSHYILLSWIVRVIGHQCLPMLEHFFLVLCTLPRCWATVVTPIVS